MRREKAKGERKMRNRKLRAMAEGAVLLALALVFNALKLFTLPNGGSVDLAMGRVE